MTTPSILTIGHSSHPFEDFLVLLKQHGVNAVIDVRSAPYSGRHPAYNREPLAPSLTEVGVQYHFLGRELGARSTDPNCYEDSRVRYERLAQTPLFQSGIDQVLQLAGDSRVALLCAEKEPLDCHRTILVARVLDSRGVPVAHIHADGHLESHGEAMDRLLALHHRSEPELFRSKDEILEEVLAIQEQRIAFVDHSLATHSSGAAT